MQILRWIDVVLIVSVFFVSSGCQKSPTPKPVADEPTFQKPTATEVFNLRTKCAELGEEINGKYDFTGSELAATHRLLITQEHFSHYDPQTNRCYVELSDTVNIAFLTVLSKGNADRKSVV